MSARVMTAAPCAKCPFRKDVPIYLRRDRRVEIATALLEGRTFHCHATVDYSNEDDEGFCEPDTTESIACAGAAKAMLVIGTSTQMMRIEDRLGLLDLERVEEHGAECWDLHEWQRLPEGATAADPGDDEDGSVGEPCSVCGPGCLAPAGYAVGGGVVYGTEAADCECEECGDRVCSACITDDGLCSFCAPWDDEDDDLETSPVSVVGGL